MYIGADEGGHAVPELIPPIGIAFFSLDPTRMPMSSPFITISGSIFPDMSGFIPGICPIGLAEGLADGIGMFIPGIWPIGLAEGLADGIGMFIFVWGEA